MEVKLAGQSMRLLAAGLMSIQEDMWMDVANINTAQKFHTKSQIGDYMPGHVTCSKIFSYLQTWTVVLARTCAWHQDSFEVELKS